MHCPKTRSKGEFAFGVITLFVCLFAYCSSLITYRISFVIFALSIMLMIALAVRSGRVMSFDLRAIVPLLPWGAVAVMAAIGFVLGGGYDLSATIALVSVVVISYLQLKTLIGFCLPLKFLLGCYSFLHWQLLPAM